MVVSIKENPNTLPLESPTNPYFTPKDHPLCFVFPDTTERAEQAPSLAGKVTSQSWPVTVNDVHALLNLLSSARLNLSSDSLEDIQEWHRLNDQVTALTEQNQPQEAFALLASFPFTTSGKKICACTKRLSMNSSVSTSPIDWNHLSPQVWQVLKLFSHLEQIELAGISLESFPSSVLPSLQKLHTLSVVCSEMTKLPDWIAECKTLETLNLEHNKLNKLPPVHLMPNLKHLNMYGNIPLLRGLSLDSRRPVSGLHVLNGKPWIMSLPTFNPKTCIDAWVVERDPLELLPGVPPFVGTTMMPIKLYLNNLPLHESFKQLETLNLGFQADYSALISDYNIRAGQHNVAAASHIPIVTNIAREAGDLESTTQN